MKVDEVYSLYRIFGTLKRAVEEDDEAKLRKRIRTAVSLLEMIAFRIRISDEKWKELEGNS